MGYALVNSIVSGILKTGSVETEAMADGFAGAQFETPFGRAMWRGLDHQATLGAFVGKLGVKDGKGTMVDWHYVDGKDALPSDEEVKKMRPG